MRLFPGLLLAACVPAIATAAILNGQITGPAGAGVHPLDIDVHDSDTHVLLNTPDDSTDANGNYSIVVPAGKYDLTFNPPVGSHLFRETRNGISVNSVTTTNRTLSAGRYLFGRIVDKNGAGVAAASIHLRDSASGAAPASVQDDLTDAQGNYSTLMTPGTYDADLIPAESSRKVPQRFTDIALTTVDQSLGVKTVENGFLVTGSITDQSLFPLTLADFDVQVAGKSTKLVTPTDNTDGSGVASFVVPPGVYDFTGNPPSGVTLATRTAQSITVTADRTLPNLALSPGATVTAHCVNSSGTPVVNADFDADSLPDLHRLHTPHDASDALGNVSVIVSLYSFRMNIAPPVATRLLPVVLDSVQITRAKNLGTLVHLAGHWVSVTVTEQFTGMPLEGANLDFVDVATGKKFLTLDDVTIASGFTRVVTDQRLFNLIVRGPTPAFANLALNGFRTLNDTTLSVALDYDHTLGVSPAGGPSLELSAPWPNPARDEVSASIVASVPSDVELSVLDLAGRRVASLFRGRVFGRHSVVWDERDARGNTVPPGSYLLRLTDGRTTRTRRVAMVR